ncbi:IclR family transcriptional regulator [Lacrimispora sp. 210928-DFI.3.58]|uniref:IclR family transcriptional regulator n=1 Tax=Lacrimispora sp. 210928-DFI.3.58 TaxID=2883214 RepID=UPI0015B6EFAC|nr:IclR family transcriptional regulator [Lacrimispora sp. 210928-DFI.3.58]MCB7320394.1 IclR family transcriptional regulator [Lacrimispora sp. 210928-DFI.3.58]
MKLNRTALRTVEILKLISKKPDGITLDEICERLDMPKTSAYDIVTTLVHTGMIHVAREQKQRYTIGLTAYRIGINYTNNLDFIGTIEPVLKAFSREVGKTVFFGVRSDDAIVYICKFEPENPIITTATVGTKNPIYCTSLGKAIMAYTEEEDREDVINRMAFKQHTDRTITTKEAFRRELELVKEKGYALDARELEEHMECVGAPVFGQDGSVMGAISVSSLYKPTEDYDALGCLAHTKAVELSRLLGYLGKF